MPIVIREAVKEDLSGVLLLYAQPDMDDEQALPLEQAEGIFAKMTSYPNYKLYVALDGDEIVGTFALAVMDNLAHQGACSGLIEDVVVKHNRQGKGIGRQMMAHAMECCRQNGCYKVALSSNVKRTNAHWFYESLGFERHGFSFVVQL